MYLDTSLSGSLLDTFNECAVSPRRLGRGSQAKSLIWHGIVVGEENQDAENFQISSLPQQGSTTDH